jgi:hypothetical protein
MDTHLLYQHNSSLSHNIQYKKHMYNVLKRPTFYNEIAKI